MFVSQLSQSLVVKDSTLRRIKTGMEQEFCILNMVESIRKQENKMQQNINIMALLTLAQSGKNQDIVSAGVSDIIEADDELSAAIADIEKESRTAAIKAAATTIVELDGASNRAIEMRVLELRALRHRERELQAQIEGINTARAYGKETRNYLPLVRYVGVINHNANINSSLLFVPDGWKPTVKTEVKPVAKAKTAVKK